MKNLVDKILLAKSGDEDVMLEILNLFSPLIKKYTRLLNYDEDCRSELILKIITLVKNEIEPDKMQLLNDGAIISYISNAMYHHYIWLSRGISKIRDNETTCEGETLINVLDNSHFNPDEMEDGLLMETLRSILTERELICIKLIVLEGYTAKYVADKLGVTKQAVNQCKNRALKKLKKYFI